MDGVDSKDIKKPFKTVQEQPNYCLLFLGNNRKKDDLQSKLFAMLFEDNKDE